MDGGVEGVEDRSNPLLLFLDRKVDLNASKLALSQFRSCAACDVFSNVFVNDAPKNEALIYASLCPDDVRVVIDPSGAIDSVGDWTGGKVVKIPAVFGQQDERFIEKWLVNPPLKAVRAVVRNSACTPHTFGTVDWESEVIQDVHDIR